MGVQNSGGGEEGGGWDGAVTEQGGVSSPLGA